MTALLALYFVAQWLIALSTSSAHAGDPMHQTNG